jgi:hypothetical protein
MHSAELLELPLLEIPQFTCFTLPYFENRIAEVAISSEASKRVAKCKISKLGLTASFIRPASDVFRISEGCFGRVMMNVGRDWRKALLGTSP